MPRNAHDNKCYQAHDRGGSSGWTSLIEKEKLRTAEKKADKKNKGTDSTKK
jgi:hypothetical protein